MITYSFIALFRDGTTCTSQHHGNNLLQACLAWKEYIGTGIISGLKMADFMEAFDDYLEDDPPSAIHTLTNMWAWGFAFGPPKRQGFEVYIIRTDGVQEETTISAVDEKLARMP